MPNARIHTLRAIHSHFVTTIPGHKLVATAEEREHRQNACFFAAALYGLCLLLSGVCWVRGSKEAAREKWTNKRGLDD